MIQSQAQIPPETFIQFHSQITLALQEGIRLRKLPRDSIVRRHKLRISRHRVDISFPLQNKLFCRRKPAFKLATLTFLIVTARLFSAYSWDITILFFWVPRVGLISPSCNHSDWLPQAGIPGLSAIRWCLLTGLSSSSPHHLIIISLVWVSFPSFIYCLAEESSSLQPHE